MMKRELRSLKKYLAIVLFMATSFTIGNNTYVNAADYNVDDSHYDENEQKIYDNADLLSDEEEEEISEALVKVAKETKLDIVVLTVEGNGGKTPAKYAADFYDNKGFDYDRDRGSGVILYVDMKNRDICVSMAGMAKLYITGDEADEISENIAPYMTDGDYAEGVEYFVKEVRNEAKDGLKDGDYEEAREAWYTEGIKTTDSMEDFYDEYVYKEATLFTYLKNPLISLVAALVIAALAILIMSFSSKTKVTVTGRTYMKGNTFKLNRKSDRFTHTTTTKRKIESNNNSSGGGGRTISSSGNSHTSGGSKF